MRELDYTWDVICQVNFQPSMFLSELPLIMCVRV
jgi:hypothetical protein